MEELIVLEKGAFGFNEPNFFTCGCFCSPIKGGDNPN